MVSAKRAARALKKAELKSTSAASTAAFVGRPPPSPKAVFPVEKTVGVVSSAAPITVAPPSINVATPIIDPLVMTGLLNASNKLDHRVFSACFGDMSVTDNVSPVVHTVIEPFEVYISHVHNPPVYGIHFGDAEAVKTKQLNLGILGVVRDGIFSIKDTVGCLREELRAGIREVEAVLEEAGRCVAADAAVAAAAIEAASRDAATLEALEVVEPAAVIGTTSFNVAAVQEPLEVAEPVADVVVAATSVRDPRVFSIAFGDLESDDEESAVINTVNAESGSESAGVEAETETTAIEWFNSINTVDAVTEACVTVVDECIDVVKTVASAVAPIESFEVVDTTISLDTVDAITEAHVAVFDKVETDTVNIADIINVVDAVDATDSLDVVDGSEKVEVGAEEVISLDVELVVGADIETPDVNTISDYESTDVDEETFTIAAIEYFKAVNTTTNTLDAVDAVTEADVVVVDESVNVVETDTSAIVTTESFDVVDTTIPFDTVDFEKVDIAVLEESIDFGPSVDAEFFVDTDIETPEVGNTTSDHEPIDVDVGAETDESTCTATAIGWFNTIDTADSDDTVGSPMGFSFADFGEVIGVQSVETVVEYIVDYDTTIPSPGVFGTVTIINEQNIGAVVREVGVTESVIGADATVDDAFVNFRVVNNITEIEEQNVCAVAEEIAANKSVNTYDGRMGAAIAVAEDSDGVEWECVVGVDTFVVDTNIQTSEMANNTPEIEERTTITVFEDTINDFDIVETVGTAGTAVEIDTSSVIDTTQSPEVANTTMEIDDQAFSGDFVREVNLIMLVGVVDDSDALTNDISTEPTDAVDDHMDFDFAVFDVMGFENIGVDAEVTIEYDTNIESPGVFGTITTINDQAVGAIFDEVSLVGSVIAVDAPAELDTSLIIGNTIQPPEFIDTTTEFAEQSVITTSEANDITSNFNIIDSVMELDASITSSAIEYINPIDDATTIACTLSENIVTDFGVTEFISTIDAVVDLELSAVVTDTIQSAGIVNITTNITPIITNVISDSVANSVDADFIAFVEGLIISTNFVESVNTAKIANEIDTQTIDTTSTNTVKSTNTFVDSKLDALNIDKYALKDLDIIDASTSIATPTIYPNMMPSADLVRIALDTHKISDAVSDEIIDAIDTAPKISNTTTTVTDKISVGVSVDVAKLDTSTTTPKPVDTTIESDTETTTKGSGYTIKHADLVDSTLELNPSIIDTTTLITPYDASTMRSSPYKNDSGSVSDASINIVSTVIIDYSPAVREPEVENNDMITGSLTMPPPQGLRRAIVEILAAMPALMASVNLESPKLTETTDINNPITTATNPPRPQFDSATMFNSICPTTVFNCICDNLTVSESTTIMGWFSDEQDLINAGLSAITAKSRIVPARWKFMLRNMVKIVAEVVGDYTIESDIGAGVVGVVDPVYGGSEMDIDENNVEITEDIAIVTEAAIAEEAVVFEESFEEEKVEEGEGLAAKRAEDDVEKVEKEEEEKVFAKQVKRATPAEAREVGSFGAPAKPKSPRSPLSQEFVPTTEACAVSPPSSPSPPRPSSRNTMRDTMIVAYVNETRALDVLVEAQQVAFGQDKADAWADAAEKVKVEEKRLRAAAKLAVEQVEEETEVQINRAREYARGAAAEVKALRKEAEDLIAEADEARLRAEEANLALEASNARVQELEHQAVFLAEQLRELHLRLSAPPASSPTSDESGRLILAAIGVAAVRKHGKAPLIVCSPVCPPRQPYRDMRGASPPPLPAPPTTSFEEGIRSLLRHSFSSLPLPMVLFSPPPSPPLSSVSH